MVLFLHLCHLHAFIKIILNTLDCTQFSPPELIFSSFRATRAEHPEPRPQAAGPCLPPAVQEAPAIIQELPPAASPVLAQALPTPPSRPMDLRWSLEDLASPTEAQEDPDRCIPQVMTNICSTHDVHCDHLRPGVGGRSVSSGPGLKCELRLCGGRAQPSLQLTDPNRQEPPSPRTIQRGLRNLTLWSS